MKTTKKPIIGLSPMDGVTDAAFRKVVDSCGGCNLFITEFVSVDGVERGSPKFLESLVYRKLAAPLILQLFGSSPELFYQSVFLGCELGYDGVDINMGCPDRSVVKKGGGSALINNPNLAYSIITSVKEAVNDWHNGKSISEVILRPELTTFVQKYKKSFKNINKKLVTVKTRIGYNKFSMSWIEKILDAKPDAIFLHGRTYSQAYSGKANWTALKESADVAQAQGVKLIGNGDVRSRADALEKIAEFTPDGVLIGRACRGNPWIFSGKEPSAEERFSTMFEHAKYFVKIYPDIPFVAMRKHLMWYCNGLEGATDMRSFLSQVSSLKELEVFVSEKRCLNP